MTEDMMAMLIVANKLPELLVIGAFLYFAWRCTTLLQRLVNSVERHR